MATIMDVARLAGVSPATVSRVLNNSGYVSAETRRKVNEAIRQLNYSPSQIARGLVNRKTNTLGLLLPDITNPFFPELARSIEDTAQSNGYAVIFCNTDGDFEKEKKYIQILIEKCVDGIIVIQQLAPSNLHLLYQTDIPLVITDADARMDQHLSLNTIYTDNRSGGEVATAHLIESGYQRVGHIRGPFGMTSGDDRYEGYKAALEKFGLDYDSTIVQLGDFHIKSGFEAMRRLLALSTPPDAVFVANDLMALGALEAVRLTNINIPEELGIIGFDGIPFTEVIYPKLTTIQQPFYKNGVMATNLLIEVIETGNKDVKNITLQPELVIRGTTRRGGT